MALALWSETHSGKYRRTRLFVMTLGYSRKSVRPIVCRSSSQAWAELRERAFRRPTGVTRVFVLDNLREGVLAPDIRTAALRRRPSALPRRKREGRKTSRSREEYVTEGPAVRKPGGRPDKFTTTGKTRWADTRIRGTTGRQVGVMFAEKAAVLPLAVRTFSLLPPGWIGRRVQVQRNLSQVRLNPETGQALCEHSRQARGGK